MNKNRFIRQMLPITGNSIPDPGTVFMENSWDFMFVVKITERRLIHTSVCRLPSAVEIRVREHPVIYFKPQGKEVPGRLGRPSHDDPAVHWESVFLLYFGKRYIKVRIESVMRRTNAQHIAVGENNRLRRRLHVPRPYRQFCRIVTEVPRSLYGSLRRRNHVLDKLYVRHVMVD